MHETRRDHGGSALGFFLFLIVITLGFVAASPARAASATLSLHVVGESPISDAGTPVLVAGIWHDITVNLTATLTAPLTLTAAYSGGGAHSIATFYEWVRNEANGSWYDPLYGTFVRSDLSSDSGLQIVFAAGVDARATPGTWTLTAQEGNATLASLTIEVQSANLGFGVAAADFNIRIDPFQQVDVTTQASNQYVRIVNQGNVPMGVSLTFDLLTSSLSVANPSNVSHIGGNAQYFLRLRMGAQPPEVIVVNGSATMTVLYAIPSPGATTLVPAFSEPFTVTVTVGRSGYAVHQVGNVAFETLNEVSVDVGHVTTWNVYLSGGQNVSLDLSLSGARLLGVFEGSTAVALPVTLTLSPSGETSLSIQVEPTGAANGAAVFTLSLQTTGDVRTFTTTLVVSGGPSAGTGTVSLLWIAGAAMAAAVFVFVSFNTIRHRMRLKAESQKSTKKKGYNARREERARSRGPRHGKPQNRQARSNGVGQDQRGTAPAKGRRP